MKYRLTFMMIYIALTSHAFAAVDITRHGAIGDGKTDNSAAIAAAITAAKAAGDSVYVPPGMFAYSTVIKLDGVKLVGAGSTSILHATDWRNEAIFLYGDGPGVSAVRLSGVEAPERQAAWEATRITVFGASNFVIDSITIDHSAAAGIQTAKGAHHGRISNNAIMNTKADAIHLTDRASHIVVENNHISNAGDDGIAVVSYRGDNGMVSHITARNNIITDNLWGRQMSVVGGEDIAYENNKLSNNKAGFACLYIAQENGYKTFGAKRVTVRNSTLSNCGGAKSGHGAVMVYSDGDDTNTDITLTRNDIIQKGQSGIRVFSDGNTRITLDSNRVTGANPAYDVTSPAVSRIDYTSGPVGYVKR